MKSIYIAMGALSAASGVWSQFTVPPDTTTEPGAVADCTWWYVAVEGESCADIQSVAGLTAQEFIAYNFGDTGICKITADISYCIEQNWGLPSELPPVTPITTPTSIKSTPPVTTSTRTTSTSTSTGNGVSTPTPYQTGLVTNCDKFHQVVSGDTCATIATKYGVASADVIKWNPAAGSDCAGLWVDNYVCVRTIGYKPPATTSTTSTRTTATTTGNGVSTPTPHQTGLVSNCDKFHKVASGETCATIATKYGVASADVIKWNPAAGSDCAGLWVDNYVCVRTIGFKPATTSSTRTVVVTSTKTVNGISTPTPHQTGMATNCDKFHKVVKGDTCATIASKYGVASADVIKWNPAAGKECTGLWVDNYVCVKVLGATTTKATSTVKTTAIATPTPTQSGMASGCKKFHKVVKGDQCGNLATKYGISLSDFNKWNPGAGSDCESLWLDTYYCVGR